MGNFIKDIEKDEIRSGFLVTTDRKKIWNKEIELLLEVDRICKKNDISYVVAYGTMIGTVRHRGFIPWDDDIDVFMMRPDYMRFMEVATKEIKEPFFLQNTYTDNRIISWSKIMDEGTSAIEDWNAYNMHQGMFVDVFPLDVMPDGTDKASKIDQIMRELWICVISPNDVENGLKNGVKTGLRSNLLQKIISLPLPQRMQTYEDFCLTHFTDSANVGFQVSCWCNESSIHNKTLFERIQYMAFENIKVPVPVEYSEILDKEYGDWRKPRHIPNSHHGAVMSADIPYNVMMKGINRDLLDSVEYRWI